MKSRHARIVVRSLRLGDIPALLHLEHQQWTPQQAATAEDFRLRIQAHPTLCNGAFDADTGELLASLFCKPTSEAEWVTPGDWKTSAALHHGDAGRPDSKALFGISLTSIEPRAALQLIAFQYLAAVRGGQRHAYLGSPMPGLSRYLSRNPGASVEHYARMTKAGLPVDPQLRYYHGKGFREIVAVRENYFPHDASHDYGAILRARVPLQWLRPVLLLLPVSALRWIAAQAPRWAIPGQSSEPVPHGDPAVAGQGATGSA
nr:hypothetical protein [uncultured Caldimonas sp.]